ncbi:tetratricopeptide repeat protein [Cochleicola gelatinilyticus]|uniref:MalT-like TPR region domain-containing protein n=1 Tax=Cochleicola gelatinilyticus TaxID=1763537 RepID=A0A167GAC6_9FLAO|nr:tetratricopeptide repeat protein [Cochleicola gelatinilyticus]OAB77381.1 hypothetical protein ULVI_12845 [Cochleicola gelatinilyticus]
MIKVFQYKKIPVLLIFLAVLSSVSHLSAQTRTQLESLLKEANVSTYNDPKNAIAKGHELYKLAEHNSDFQVGALLTIANAYAVLKDHEKVFHYALKADSIAEQHKNYTDQIKVLGFIGGQYQRLKLGSRALNYLDRAYELSVAHPLPDSIQYLKGNIAFVKGLIQRDNLGCGYALPNFEEAVEVFKKSLEKPSLNASVAIALNRVGDCNFELKNFKAAQTSYSDAITYASRINSKLTIAYSKLGLAKLHFENKEHTEAIGILKEAVEIVSEMNDVGINSQLYEAIAKNYFELNDIENYNTYNALYFSEEEKLVSEEKKSLNIVAKEMASESRKKREEKRNTYTYLFLCLGIFSVLIILFIALKLIRKRRKLNEKKRNAEKASKLK